jgi:hypothetical protein
MAKAKTTVDPPRIRVQDLSWPLRVMITLSAVTAGLLLIWFAYALIALLTYSY